MVHRLSHLRGQPASSQYYHDRLMSNSRPASTTGLSEAPKASISVFLFAISSGFASAKVQVRLVWMMMVHPVQRCFRTVGQLSLLCFDSRQVLFRRCLQLLLVRLAEEQEHFPHCHWLKHFLTSTLISYLFLNKVREVSCLYVICHRS